MVYDEGTCTTATTERLHFVGQNKTEQGSYPSIQKREEEEEEKEHSNIGKTDTRRPVGS